MYSHILPHRMSHQCHGQRRELHLIFLSEFGLMAGKALYSVIYDGCDIQDAAVDVSALWSVLSVY